MTDLTAAPHRTARHFFRFLEWMTAPNMTRTHESNVQNNIFTLSGQGSIPFPVELLYTVNL